MLFQFVVVRVGWLFAFGWVSRYWEREIDREYYSGCSRGGKIIFLGRDSRGDGKGSPAPCILRQYHELTKKNSPKEKGADVKLSNTDPSSVT